MVLPKSYLAGQKSAPSATARYGSDESCATFSSEGSAPIKLAPPSRIKHHPKACATRRCPAWVITAFGLLLVAVCCSVSGVVSWRAAVTGDTEQARLAFDASVTQQTTALQTYVNAQLRVGRTLAAAVTVREDVPRHDLWLAAMEPYAELLEGGGTLVIRRLNATREAWDDFAAEVLRRDGVDVSMRPPSSLSMDPPPEEMVVYVQAAWRYVIGAEAHSLSGPLRLVVERLSPQQQQAASGLITPRGSPTDPMSIAVYTAVPDDNPKPATFVASFAAMTDQVQSAASATEARVVLRDNVGGYLDVSSCPDGKVEASLSRTTYITITAGEEWAVEVTACASLVSRFETGRRWEVLAATVIVAGVLVGGLMATSVAVDRASAAHRKASQLAAAEAAHGTLVGHLAHELRNPLHVLRSWFPALVGCDDDGNVIPAECGDELEAEDKAAAVRDVHSALHLMSSTVNDVLDFRQLSAGKFTVTMETCRLQATVVSMLEQCASYLPVGVGVQLMWWGCDGGGAEVVGRVASTRLNQVVNNGMSNAGKAGVRVGGNVVVRAGVVDGRWLVFDLGNHGQGLPKDTSALFVPFQRRGLGVGSWEGTQASDKYIAGMRRRWRRLMAGVDHVAPAQVASGARRVGAPTNHSTGLGLPLSRAFAKSCGGWLGLEDDEQGWTHFWGVFPVDMDLDAAPAEPSQPSCNKVVPMTATVPPSAYSSCAMSLGGVQLDSVGESHVVRLGGTRAACNRLASVASAAFSASTLRTVSVEEPEPQLPGACVVSPAPAPAAPSVASPPVDATTSSGPSNPAAQPPVATPAPTGVDWATLRVAVVDDEAPNRRVLQRLLQQCGAARPNIRMYTDGEGAEEALGEAWADVMLLDNSMPGRSGLQTVVAARESGTWDGARPLVLAATGSVEPQAVAAYEAAGMVGVLCKPFTRAAVREAVEKAVLASGGAGFFRLLG